MILIAVYGMNLFTYNLLSTFKKSSAKSLLLKKVAQKVYF